MLEHDLVVYRDFGALEVVFTKADGTEVGRAKQPVQVEPGKFGRQLVKSALTWDDYGTIEAHCSVDGKYKCWLPRSTISSNTARADW